MRDGHKILQNKNVIKLKQYKLSWVYTPKQMREQEQEQ